ncbi:cation-translocating P-type ATPase [Aspergillus stella-maris]|uniref:cation-translocating P-type ATPase n=1 Tax=Aspergillus stella-maris TaxID=1810926 RepID=UPI003CCDF0B4
MTTDYSHRAQIVEDGIHQNQTRSISRRSSSLSIHSARGRVVAPGNLLPITFRTLSFKLDDTIDNGLKGFSNNSKQEREQIEGLADLDYHLLSVEELQQHFSTSTQGLQTRQNQPSPPPSGWFRTLMCYMFGGVGSILLGGGILVFIAWKPLGNPPAEANLALAIVLVAVWAIQVAFNGWQDWSSSQVMASITTMLPDQCIAVRNGAPTFLSAIDLGNKLPADVRFIQTSESELVHGTVESTNPNFLETNNIGLQGTYCVSGAALGIVVGTEDRTVFGRIASLSNKRRTGFTPMQKEIFRFVLIIVSFVVVFVLMIVIIWAVYLRKDHSDFIDVPTLIVSCVSVGIAFIPEGLPIAISRGLTISANIMKKNKVLCKPLVTVETLGSVSNEMFVTECFSGGEEYTAEDAKQRMTQSVYNRLVNCLREACGLCNAAEFDASTLNRPLHAMKIVGDPTDQAILRLSQSLGSVSELRSQWKKVFEIPFNSKNKFMVRVMQQRGQEAGYLIKGAPDVLLPKCAYAIKNNGESEHLSDYERNKIEAVKDRWSVKGKRVILMAQKPVSSDWLDAAQDEKKVLCAAQEGLTLVGIVGLIDPPRDEIPNVIDTLRKASIRIVMVTGDYKLTAQAIAIECGIIKTPSDLIDNIKALEHFEKTAIKDPGSTTAIVISGPKLADLTDTDFDRLCSYDEIVFARTTPEQKLRIVKEFQARNNIVAMTGDGVNDAPSLKVADVGVAPGSGSDIAIEAADIVLLDSFSAIVEAVRSGRLVYDNLKKSVIYLLSAGSFSDCLTDCAGAITLAYEKPESDLLRPPRNPKKDRLVNTKLIGHAYLFIGLYECFLSYVMAFWHMQRRGIPFSAMVLHYGSWPPQYDPDYVTQVANETSSVYFVNLVFMQFFNLLAVQTRRLCIVFICEYPSSIFSISLVGLYG